MIHWPWLPHAVPASVDNAVQAGQMALQHAYLAGFKDGLLSAVAVFSILVVLFRRD
ncbi:MAG TPA: hypothetical protein VMF69_05765 [Gemmataceae bacterium]|nr:hypothetical protein [Gemmataceae bacterium]